MTRLKGLDKTAHARIVRPRTVMKEKIASVQAEALARIGGIADMKALEEARVAVLKAKYDMLLDLAEKQSRRFRNRYSRMNSPQFAQRLNEVSARGVELRGKLRAVKKERKREKALKK